MEKDPWDIIDTYFKDNKNYLTKHHIDSYNDFITNKIPQTFKQYNPQVIYKEYREDTDNYKYEIKIYYGGKDSNRIYIGKPVIYTEDEFSSNKRLMFPNEARLRNLSYSSHIFCDIEVEYVIRGEEENVQTLVYEKVNVGKIPIMLQSKLCPLNDANFETKKQMGECPYDQGGYFIVEGQEKVIVSHERKAENKLYILKSSEGPILYSAQIKSVPESDFKYARTTVINLMSNDNVIMVKLPCLTKPVPLFVMFRALGIESDKEILKHILYDLDNEKSKLFFELLRPSIHNNGPIYNQEMAIKYLSTYTIGGTISHILDIISTDLFPHVGDNYKNKAYYLGYVVHKLLNVYQGIDETTDRDNFVYKRVDLSGFLLAALFRENYRQFQRDTGIAIDTEYRFNTAEYQDENFSNIINVSNIKKIFKGDVIENAFLKSFKIGTILNKVGLIQALNRLNNINAISHLRRLNTPTQSSTGAAQAVQVSQRKLHNTQFGIICPTHSPDGGNIGIKKHFTLTTHITFGCSSKPIIKCLRKFKMLYLDEVQSESMINLTKIFVNGNWVGVHNDPKVIVTMLKLFRRNSIINVFTSISWNVKDMEIIISTDGGRCCRPLFTVNNNNLLISDEDLNKIKKKELRWIDLCGGKNHKFKSVEELQFYCDFSINPDEDISSDQLIQNQGCLEFIDTEESTYNLIAMMQKDLSNKLNKYSYCEIHPCLMFGAIGSTIPFTNKNQLPRNVYGAGQSKQAVSIYISNYKNRFDTSAHLLYYPQKPLVRPRMSKYIFSDKLPTGINAIVAIASHTGYNQEDSIIFNRSSLERGLFRSCKFSIYSDKEMFSRENNTEDIFYNPSTEENQYITPRKEFDYSNLDSNGIIKEKTIVKDNDVLISKYTKYSRFDLVDNSVVAKDSNGIVDKVFCDFTNTNKDRMCRVRVSSERVPMIGDKFASRHGQKGVIGLVLPQEDMPFTKDGLVPDLIINPHAIPSRMTIGQFTECLMGKVCTNLGIYGDGTPFGADINDDLGNILENECGMNKYGDEVLYSGIMGEQITTKIFIGPTYYQRLKHMVKDKINSRERGKVTLKTRQPPSGKAIGGGLRIGEMERDAILAHGCMGFLKETMMERSDAYEYHISENTGMISIANPNTNTFICPTVDGPLNFEDSSDLKLLNNQSKASLCKINVPYNTKMLIQECEAMGIALRLIPKQIKKYEELDLSYNEFKPQIEAKVKSKKTEVFDPNQPSSKKQLKVGDFVKITKRGEHQESQGKILQHVRKDTFKIVLETGVNKGKNVIFFEKFLEKIDKITDVYGSYVPPTTYGSYGYGGPPTTYGSYGYGGPALNTGNLAYKPTSPSYLPTSPSYLPTSPTYQPPTITKLTRSSIDEPFGFSIKVNDYGQKVISNITKPENLSNVYEGDIVSDLNKKNTNALSIDEVLEIINTSLEIEIETSKPNIPILNPPSPDYSPYTTSELSRNSLDESFNFSVEINSIGDMILTNITNTELLKKVNENDELVIINDIYTREKSLDEINKIINESMMLVLKTSKPYKPHSPTYAPHSPTYAPPDDSAPKIFTFEPHTGPDIDLKSTKLSPKTPPPDNNVYNPDSSKEKKSLYDYFKKGENQPPTFEGGKPNEIESESNLELNPIELESNLELNPINLESELESDNKLLTKGGQIENMESSDINEMEFKLTDLETTDSNEINLENLMNENDLTLPNPDINNNENASLKEIDLNLEEKDLTDNSLDEISIGNSELEEIKL